MFISGGKKKYKFRKKRKKKVNGKQVKITDFFKKTDVKSKNTIVNVFTDGSCINNKRGSTKAKGGIGVFWGKNDPDNVGDPFLLFPITNNRTEFYAVIKALEIFSKKYKKYQKKDKIIILNIYSDSKNVINTMTKWIHNWKKRGWKKANGNNPLNTDLILCLDSLIENNKDNFKVKFKHVKAHLEEPKDKESDEYFLWYGNNKADKLALKGSRKLKKTQKIFKSII